MPRRSDILLIKNFNDEQLKRLLQQLAHLKEYNELLDYAYDASTILNNKFKIGENVLISIESIYSSQFKRETEDINFPDNKIVGKIIDPLFVKENYYLVEISSPVCKYTIEIFYNYICKINII